MRLQSDELTLHVEVLDEMREQNLVSAALARVDATSQVDDEQQRRAAEELAFLPGDAAALAKYRAYTELGQRRMFTNARGVIERGFAMSRHPELILEQFERELADLTQPVSNQAIYEAARLRMLVEHPDSASQASGPVPPPLGGPDPRSVIRRRYVDDAINSLAGRTGRNRIDSAMALLGEAGLPSPPAVLDIVLDVFDQLSVAERYDLIISVMHDVRDPRLTAGLARAVRESSPEYLNALLEALALRDPSAAVAPVIAALGNPTVTILRSTFDKMPPGSLAAAGSGIVSALRTLAASAQKNQFRIEQKSVALELVADSSVLSEVNAFYDANQASLSREARAHFLAYIARWDAKNGAASLRKAVMADGRLLDQLARSSAVPGLDQLARERLFDADVDVALASASALGHVGIASDRVLIEQRLTQWRDAFRARGASETQSDGYTEMALLMAATSGNQWRLAGADWDRLYAGCVTDRCRAMRR